MSEWNYGDAYKRHPIGAGEIVSFDNGSLVKVHDIFNPLPNFMRKADLLFSDPPWNQGNMRSFYTKADIDSYHRYDEFYTRLFECVAKVSPMVCYIEIGKDYLGEFIQKMKSIYRHVAIYNSNYYHKRDNICYIIRGSQKRQSTPLDYMDEEDIIKWICTNEDYTCIGDLCMGRGLVGINAYKNGHRFVGTELNHKRLSVLLESIVKRGGSYKIKGENSE
jgi:hypothetical protein